MGRKRSEFVCPKCNKLGYLVESPTRNGDYLNARTRRYKYVVHYNSVTKKRMKCYVNNISPGIELNKKNDETSDFSGTTSTDDVYEKPLELDLDNCYKITEIEYRKLSKEEKLKALQHIPHFDKEYHSRIVEKKLMMEKICKESNISIPNLVNSATISPVKYHGISKTHEQIGLLAQDFINLKMACRKLQKMLFYFPPSGKIDWDSAKKIKIFRETLVIPWKKLMQPYYDGRYLSPYRDQFSLILDSLIYGKSAARTRQSLPIGKSIMELSSDQKVITTHDLVRRLSVKQLGEKNQKKILKLAIDVLTMHNLESALYSWVKNTGFDEVITTPEKFYEQKTGKKAKFTVEESLNNVKKSMTGKIKFEN